MTVGRATENLTDPSNNKVKRSFSLSQFIRLSLTLYQECNDKAGEYQHRRVVYLVNLVSLRVRWTISGPTTWCWWTREGEGGHSGSIVTT